MGKGKSMLASTILSRLYMQGYDVLSTSDAGFRFGTIITPDPTDTAKLFSFSSWVKNAYLFIDELLAYLDKMSNQQIAHRIFVQCMNALRKNHVHLVISAQDDSQITNTILSRIDTAIYPEPMPIIQIRRMGQHWMPKPPPPTPKPIPGKTPECKLAATVIYGQNCLESNIPPNAAMRLRGLVYPPPRHKRILIPYEHVRWGAALYDSFADLNVGAGISTDAKAMRKHGMKQNQPKNDAE